MVSTSLIFLAVQQATMLDSSTGEQAMYRAALATLAASSTST